MMAKITTYPSPVTQGPQIGPQLCIRKGAQRYFFFKNVFDHVFSTMPGFKSLKNTFFCDFRPLLCHSQPPGPPKQAPNYMKMLPFKNSNIFELLNNAVCLSSKRNMEVQTQGAKSNQIPDSVYENIKRSLFGVFSEKLFSDPWPRFTFFMKNFM